MASSSGLKSFRKVKRRLHELNIDWVPARGKGSHGSFIGSNQKTGRLHTFPIPRSQQREINIDYLSRLHDRFGLPADFFD